ncbi:hypothetical protein BJ973_009523 [Actinoplanes tereljensis]|uniref:Fibronectin type-III domain-containing protein n=1 Tax=Paractinoplanes tereljensis TaxID=571912 RepID=A0A919TQV9_9ACTN|nr:hypothetical protein [Actinoplanes tereljensis]GIF17512.1 hypothetical protein Ate02nite_02420 [Actinoplanes tereljensis]
MRAHRLPYVLAPALALVVTAALQPASAQPATPVDDLYALCPAAVSLEPGVEVNCAIAIEPAFSSHLTVTTTAELDVPATAMAPAFDVPILPPLTVPVPVHLATGTTAGCVTGAARPVVGTTTTLTLSATFEGPGGAQPLFEYRTTAEPDSTYTSTSIDGPDVATLDFEPGELTPGETYQWRVRGTPDETLAGWSGWCEFAVAADAPDLRELDPTEIDALAQLKIRPERDYTVKLTPAQWRTALEMYDTDDAVVVDEPTEDDQDYDRLVAAVRRQAPTSRVTLTGAQWAALSVQLAEWATIVDESALEVEPEYQVDGTAHRAVLGRISTQLGGPAHPNFG